MALGVSKQERVDSFRQWLIDNDVQFIEHQNGHFQIFHNGERVMDVWATTQRCHATNGQGFAGIYSIQKAILSLGTGV